MVTMITPITFPVIAVTGYSMVARTLHKNNKSERRNAMARGGSNGPRYTSVVDYIGAFLESGGKIFVGRHNCKFFPGTTWAMNGKEEESWRSLADACLTNTDRSDFKEIWRNTISVAEAADRLNCSGNKVRELQKDGFLSAIDFRKFMRIYEKSVSRYL